MDGRLYILISKVYKVIVCSSRHNVGYFLKKRQIDWAALEQNLKFGKVSCSRLTVVM